MRDELDLTFDLITERQHALRRQKTLNEQLNMTGLHRLNEDLLDDIDAPIEKNTAQKVVSETDDYAFSLQFTLLMRIWNTETYLKEIQKVPFVRIC